MLELAPEAAVTVTTVVEAKAVEFIIAIPTAPSTIGAVDAALLTRCMLNIQFCIVLLLQPSVPESLNIPNPTSIDAGFVTLVSVNATPSMVT